MCGRWGYDLIGHAWGLGSIPSIKEREPRVKERKTNVVYMHNGCFSATKNKVINLQGNQQATGDNGTVLVWEREALYVFFHSGSKTFDGYRKLGLCIWHKSQTETTYRTQGTNRRGVGKKEEMGYSVECTECSIYTWLKWLHGTVPCKMEIHSGKLL